MGYKKNNAVDCGYHDNVFFYVIKHLLKKILIIF